MEWFFMDLVLRKDEGRAWKPLYNPIFQEILCLLLLVPSTCKTQQYYYRLLIRFWRKRARRNREVQFCKLTAPVQGDQSCAGCEEGLKSSQITEHLKKSVELINSSVTRGIRAKLPSPHQQGLEGWPLTVPVLETHKAQLFL